MKTLKKLFTKRIEYFNVFEGEVNRRILRPWTILVLAVILMTIYVLAK